MTGKTCRANTRAGNPCKANPLKGKLYCSAHDPETPESQRFGSHAQAKEAAKLGGRPPLPKPTEVARRLVEQHVTAILRPHFKAIGLLLHDDGTVEQLDRGAVITGESKEGVVKASLIEDLGAQILAAEKLLDRVYGRPKQQTELSGPEGQPVRVDLPTEQAWHAEVAAVLHASGAVSAGPDQD